MKDIGVEGVIRSRKPRTTIPDKAMPYPLNNGKPPVPRTSAKRTLGERLHLCRDVARVCVCDLRHRCLCSPNSRVACPSHRHCRICHGCFGTGNSRTQASTEPIGTSFRSRITIPLAQIHQTTGRGEDRPSVGSVEDSYDNALAETINGLFKAEVIHRRGPWRSFEAVEYATIEWVE